MVLGLPLGVLARDLLTIGVYVALVILCLPRRHEGRWAQLGVLAGALGALLQGWFLLAWVLYRQFSITGPIELAGTPVVDQLLVWTSLVVVGVLVAAVLPDRSPPRASDQP